MNFSMIEDNEIKEQFKEPIEDDKQLALEQAERDKEFLTQVRRWKQDGEDGIKIRWSKWQENIKQVKGEFPLEESARSKVRGRSKLFWRKTWATVWRLLATMYQVFLKEDSVKIEGRMGTDKDVPRAKVLTEIVKYRVDLMNTKSDLFVKFIWSILDILQLGNAIGKIRWVKTETRDEPEFISYNPENAFFDPHATTQEDMKYIILETSLSMEDLRDAGFKNLEDCKPSSRMDNIVTAARESSGSSLIRPPLSADSNYYPPDGSGDRLGMTTGKTYKVWEVLWKRAGKVFYTVTNEGHAILQYPMETPFEVYPVIIGNCLIEPHSLLGEGFPEPMSGPQDSANATLNMRKDAVALALAPHRIVSRYAGVDLQSLTNARVGGVTMVNDMNGVVTEQVSDVTQKAYIEVDSDDLMMQEMSGITAQREGLTAQAGEKATVANIRYQESGTKLDLYIGIIAETFFKKFYRLLAYMIQKFETNETAFRIANAQLREDDPDHPEIWTIDSFEADYIIRVGTDVLGKEKQVNQAMMAIDRATASNASIFQLIQLGVIPPDKAIIFDVTKFMGDLLPLIGFKNIKDYLLQLQPPQPVGAGANVAGMPSPPRQTPPTNTGVMA